MVRSELIVVLGLTLLVNTSVQQRSLKTGYEYANKHIGNDQLHKDLKCGYLFGGYTQMRLLKLLLEEPYCTELKFLVGQFASMNTVVRYQINSLFGLNGIHIGAMWLLHLFTALVEIQYRDSEQPVVDFANIFETLVYVIGKLEADLAGCRKGNSFDRYDKVLKTFKTSFNVSVYKHIILAQYLDEARRLVDGNRKGRLPNGPHLVHTKIHSLFMENMGANGRFVDDLQNVYNLQMEWNQTGAVLSEAWAKARYLDWHNTGLGHLEAYHNACFDLLKIVMVRLTLKHLAYLQVYTVVGSASYVHYAQKWYNIVVRFGAALSLSDDLHVYGLLNTFRSVIYTDTQTLVGVVVGYLNATLMTLCRAFQCRAGDRPFLDNREFTIPHKSLNAKQMKSLPPIIAISSVPIEYHSLANAETYLSHLKLAFKYVNFGTVRSLREYADQLKQTDCVDGSEDCCTEELENLHLVDLSEYE